VSDVLVARQPIFDPRLDVTAYELLFRGANAERAVFSDHDEATSTVVINAFTELGLDTVVGDHRAWVNVSRDFVVQSMAFALPRERVVLELLEDQQADDELLAALDGLRAEGYTVALDDFAWADDRLPLLPHVDVVKVEVLGRDFADVAADVERLRPYGHKLLAEKLETQEDYRGGAASTSASSSSRATSSASRRPCRRAAWRRTGSPCSSSWPRSRTRTSSSRSSSS
jgi:EAL and modified HD-GYP domain-containing signal transduction protein